MGEVSSIQVFSSQLLFLTPALFFSWSAVEIIVWFFIQAVVSAGVIYFFIKQQQSTRITANSNRSNFSIMVILILLICYGALQKVIGNFFDSISYTDLGIVILAVLASETIKRINLFKKDRSRLHNIGFSGKGEWFASNSVFFIVILLSFIFTSDSGAPLQAFDFAALLILIKIGGEWLTFYFRNKKVALV